jgi:putative SOS response-associated peptidase YedK
MCGRYRLTRPEKLAGRFAIEPDVDWAPRFNIAPARPGYV